MNINAQYLAPHNRFVGDGGPAATLVRGEDRFGLFRPDGEPTDRLDGAVVDRWRARDAAMKASFETGG